MLTNNNLLLEIKNLIATARETAVRSVDFQRTLLYWYIGERIFNEEQQGKERAEYGNYLIKFLSEQLQPEFGSGFSFRNLNWYRQFYRTFPIVNSLRSQLSWTHYKLLPILVILTLFSCSEVRKKDIDEIVLAEYIVEKNGFYFSGDCEIHIGDKFTGSSKNYYENGNIKGTFILKNGLPNGHWEQFNKDGSKKLDLYFENGNLIKKQKTK